MDFGQILISIGILGMLSSFFGMAFPESSSKISNFIGMKNICGTPEKVVKFSHWEFLVSIIIFLIGMNI